MPIQYQLSGQAVNSSGHIESLNGVVNTAEEAQNMIANFDRAHAGWSISGEKYTQFGEGEVQQDTGRSALDRELDAKIGDVNPSLQPQPTGITKGGSGTNQTSNVVNAGGSFIPIEQFNYNLNQAVASNQISPQSAAQLKINSMGGNAAQYFPGDFSNEISSNPVGYHPAEQSEIQKIAQQAAQQTTAVGIIQKYRQLPSSYQNPETLKSIAEASISNQESYAPLTLLGRPTQLNSPEFTPYAAASRGIETLPNIPLFNQQGNSLAKTSLEFIPQKETQPSQELSLGEQITSNALSLISFASPSKLQSAFKSNIGYKQGGQSFLGLFGNKGKEIEEFGNKVAADERLQNPLISYGTLVGLGVAAEVIPKALSIGGLGYTAYLSGKTVINPTKENFANLLTIGGLGIAAEVIPRLNRLGSSSLDTTQTTSKEIYEYEKTAPVEKISSIATTPEGTIRTEGDIKIQYERSRVPELSRGRNVPQSTLMEGTLKQGSKEFELSGYQLGRNKYGVIEGNNQIIQVSPTYKGVPEVAQDYSFETIPKKTGETNIKYISPSGKLLKEININLGQENNLNFARENVIQTRQYGYKYFDVGTKLEGGGEVYNSRSIEKTGIYNAVGNEETFKGGRTIKKGFVGKATSKLYQSDFATPQKEVFTKGNSKTIELSEAGIKYVHQPKEYQNLKTFESIPLKGIAEQGVEPITKYKEPPKIMTERQRSFQSTSRFAQVKSRVQPIKSVIEKGKFLNLKYNALEEEEELVMPNQVQRKESLIVESSRTRNKLQSPQREPIYSLEDYEKILENAPRNEKPFIVPSYKQNNIQSRKIEPSTSVYTNINQKNNIDIKTFSFIKAENRTNNINRPETRTYSNPIVNTDIFARTETPTRTQAKQETKQQTQAITRIATQTNGEPPSLRPIRTPPYIPPKTPPITFQYGNSKSYKPLIKSQSNKQSRQFKGTPSLSTLFGGSGTKLTKKQLRGKEYISPYQIRKV